jgi:histidyl-tRNA synthetase
MFRYEQPQAGRRRQFFQTGVEYLGTDAPDADAEVIDLGFRFLEETGVTGVDVLINSIGDSVCRPGYLEVLRSYLEDKRPQLCVESQVTLETNPLRVLDCKVCAPQLADAPRATDHLCEPCRLHYQTVKERLEVLEIPFREDGRLVRGLDYYTRTAFEYIATGMDAAQNAVGGGGRYDGLAEALGGPHVPGVGLAMGIDRMLLASGAGGGAASALDVYVVMADRERRSDAIRLVAALRKAGLRADVSAEDRSLKAQFRAANRREAATAAVVGDEWGEGLVTVRDLTTGDQETQRIEEVAAWAMKHR